MQDEIAGAVQPWQPGHRRATPSPERGTALRRALDANEFRLVYQPLFDLGTGLLAGAEALLRWDHPTLGPVPPSDFIPLAERTGLIVPVGEWVLRQGLGEFAGWDPGGELDLTLAVNVSAHQLNNPGVVDAIAAVLAETGVRPDRLILEITETVLLEDLAAVAEVMAAVRRLGVGFALDDFGTGYSCLLYLRRLPIGTVKLDCAFVSGLGRDHADRAIVTAMVQLAHALGMRTCAEGVESYEQLGLLRELGCDLAQGYLLGRPMPGPEFAALVAAGAGSAWPEGPRRR